ELPSRPGQVPVTGRLRRRLSLEVDLGRVVDRDDAVVAHDVLGQVGVVDGGAAHGGVPVDERVLATGARGEGEDHLVGGERLAGPGRQAGLDEVDHAVDQHLRVDAEVTHARVTQQ